MSSLNAVVNPTVVNPTVVNPTVVVVANLADRSMKRKEPESANEKGRS